MAVDFKDYYRILGVDRKADDKTIKSAYRRLARKHHPDVAKSKDSGERFKEIAEAYEVLSDPEKRRRYDSLGPDWQRYTQAHQAAVPVEGSGSSTAATSAMRATSPTSFARSSATWAVAAEGREVKASGSRISSSVARAPAAATSRPASRSRSTRHFTAPARPLRWTSRSRARPAMAPATSSGSRAQLAAEVAGSRFAVRST